MACPLQRPRSSCTWDRCGVYRREPPSEATWNAKGRSRSRVTGPGCGARPGAARPRRCTSVAGLVDQRLLGDPRHHAAELGTDLFDRVGGELSTGRLERGLVDLVLQHPVAGE